jgi:transposase-like protein
MPRKGHSEEQIILALRQVEAGKKVGDVCREMDVSQQAFYSWKHGFGTERTVLPKINAPRPVSTGDCSLGYRSGSDPLERVVRSRLRSVNGHAQLSQTPHVMPDDLLLLTRC